VCFSAEVDVLAGLLVGGVGVDAARHVRRPTEWPLAALPLVLAVHQLVEAVVWWSLDGRVPAATGERAVLVYLTIAFGVLPVLVPLAVGLLEPAGRRLRFGWFVALGALVASLLVYAVLRGPVGAVVEGHHIVYDADLWRGGTLTALYVVATCGSLLVSGHRHIQVYGLANLVAVLLLAWFSQTALVSLWCVWAAVTSVAIAVHLRRAPRDGPFGRDREVLSPLSGPVGE
jgi:hypothetical protein